MALISRMGRSVFGRGRSFASRAVGSNATTSVLTAGSSMTDVWDRLPGGLRGSLVAGAGATYIGNRFSSGVSQTNETGQGDFYDFVYGTPDMDEQVFGRQMSPLSLLNPIQIVPRPGPLLGSVTGGIAGMATGIGVGALGFRRKGIAALLGVAGGAFGAGAGFTSSLSHQDRLKMSLMTSPELINRHFTARKSGYYNEEDPTFAYPIVGSASRNNYRNSMPGVNGSMVIGMYNSRGR